MRTALLTLFFRFSHRAVATSAVEPRDYILVNRGIVAVNFQNARVTSQAEPAPQARLLVFPAGAR